MNCLEILLKCRFWSNMSLVRAWDSEFLTNSQWSLKLLVPGPDFFFVFPSLVAQLVKNPPAMRETWVWSLGWEDPLEKGTTTHPSILAWSIPWTYRPLGRKESDTTEWLSLSLYWEPLVWLGSTVGPGFGWLNGGSWSRVSFKLIFQRCFEQFY